MRIRTFSRSVFCLGVLLAGAVSLRAQEIVAEPNLQLFTVLAAVSLAGGEAANNPSALSPVGAAVRAELAAKDIPSLEAWRDFYRSHRLFDPARDLGQYVSLALMLSDPPFFEPKLSLVNLPPDAADLVEAVPLLAAFYEQADMAALWQKYLPAMEQESVRYQKLLAKVILETNAYLRVDTSGYWGRRFAIYLNPFGAAGQTHARNYGDDNFIVVDPSASAPDEEIQHGWLHYMLDPYPLKYGRIVQSKAELLEIASKAPALDKTVATSFSMLLTESLIRAIQARRSAGDEQTKRRRADDAVEEGYVLAAYFFEAMEAFEQQPVGFRLYYPDMVEAISVKDEQKRLAEVQFRAEAARASNEWQWSPLDQMIRRGEDRLTQGQLDEARQIFESVAAQFGPQPRALYGLAIVASQQKQPQVARGYFTQAAAQAADPRIKAWSHIYLGRMLDLEGQREAAVGEYSAALEAGDASAETRAAAEKGLQERFSTGEPAAQDRPGTAPEPPARVRIPLGKD